MAVSSCYLIANILNFQSAAARYEFLRENEDDVPQSAELKNWEQTALLKPIASALAQ
jgi:hypothetical protein